MCHCSRKSILFSFPHSAFCAPCILSFVYSSCGWFAFSNTIVSRCLIIYLFFYRYQLTRYTLVYANELVNIGDDVCGSFYSVLLLIFLSVLSFRVCFCVIFSFIDTIYSSLSAIHFNYPFAFTLYTYNKSVCHRSVSANEFQINLNRLIQTHKKKDDFIELECFLSSLNQFWCNYHGSNSIE